MRIVVSEFVTLDGVMESPEKWSLPYQNEDTAKFKYDEMVASDALLLGETTYLEFAKSWPSRTGDFADRMNSSPKYVVTHNPIELTWSNSHSIKGEVVEEISQLKERPGRDILVAGSGILVQTLMANNLVDEYRLLVSPLVLGEGKRLFKDGSKAALELIEARAFKNGFVLLTYRPAKVRQ